MIEQTHPTPKKVTTEVFIVMPYTKAPFAEILYVFRKPTVELIEKGQSAVPGLDLRLKEKGISDTAHLRLHKWTFFNN